MAMAPSAPMRSLRPRSRAAVRQDRSRGVPLAGPCVVHGLCVFSLAPYGPPHGGFAELPVRAAGRGWDGARMLAVASVLSGGLFGG